MVVQVLIAQGDTDDALHHHGFDLVLHQLRATCIGEAGGKPLGQPDRPIGLAEQQGAGVRGDRASVEARHHMAAFHRWKFEQGGGTLCRHWGSPRNSRKTVAATRFSQNPGPNAPNSVRNAG